MSNEFKNLWNSLKHWWNKIIDVLSRFGINKKAKNLWTWVKTEYRK